MESLLAVVALLLIANLSHRSGLPARAQSEEAGRSIAVTGSGRSAWIRKDGSVYYVVYEKQYESIRVDGSDELPKQWSPSGITEEPVFLPPNFLLPT